jgi:hypothetical protein
VNRSDAATQDLPRVNDKRLSSVPAEIQPPADFVLFGDRKRYVVAASLTELRGPTSGVVTLPSHIDWSGKASYALDRPARLASMYKSVLMEATRVDDLRAWLNGEALTRLWSSLWLPSPLRHAWEERFEVLRTATATASAGPGSMYAPALIEADDQGKSDWG